MACRPRASRCPRRPPSPLHPGWPSKPLRLPPCLTHRLPACRLCRPGPPGRRLRPGRRSGGLTIRCRHRPRPSRPRRPPCCHPPSGRLHSYRPTTDIWWWPDDPLLPRVESPARASLLPDPACIERCLAQIGWPAVGSDWLYPLYTARGGLPFMSEAEREALPGLLPNAARLGLLLRGIGWPRPEGYSRPAVPWTPPPPCGPPRPDAAVLARRIPTGTARVVAGHLRWLARALTVRGRGRLAAEPCRAHGGARHAGPGASAGRGPGAACPPAAPRGAPAA
jgi:hypothetical protein